MTSKKHNESVCRICGDEDCSEMKHSLQEIKDFKKYDSMSRESLIVYLYKKDLVAKTRLKCIKRLQDELAAALDRITELANEKNELLIKK
jgi:hypothetical protein